MGSIPKVVGIDKNSKVRQLGPVYSPPYCLNLDALVAQNALLGGLVYAGPVHFRRLLDFFGICQDPLTSII